MKRFRVVCVLPLIAVTAVCAQSNPVPVVDHRSGLRMSLYPPDLRQHEAIGVQTSRRSRLSLVPGLDFRTAIAYPSGGQYASSVAVADVNGDGKLDLVVTNAYCGSGCTNGTVAVLLANGDGTFQAAVSYPSGGFGASSVAVGDVNGDGKPDLLVANQCVSGSNCNSENVDGTAAVLLGNGDGTFQTAVAYDSGGVAAGSLVVADVSGDGNLDMVVVNSCGLNFTECGTSYAANGTVGVLLGNGDGTFRPAVTYSSGGQTPFTMALADVNHDGKPDLVLANSCATSSNMGCGYSVAPGVVGVLLGNGDGTFQAAVAYGSGGDDAVSVAVADVNGDSKLDLIVTNECANDNCSGDSTIAVLLGNGDGSFQTPVISDSGSQGAFFIAAADVNGDGKFDLTISGCDGSCSNGGAVRVLSGNGDGTFQAAVTYGSGGFNAGFVAADDIDGDGKPDLLVVNSCADSTCTNGAIAVLINVSTKITTTSLNSSLNPSKFGQSVTFTATITPQGIGIPTGTVTFFDGTTSLGSSPLNGSGVGVLANSAFSIGTHSIAATYSGDANFAASTSPVLSQVVQGAIAQISPTSVNFGDQTVGINSAPQTVTLTNTGNVNLTLSSISLTYKNGAVTESNNCGALLAPGAGCTLTLSWIPSVAGAMTGSITFVDNAPNSPQIVPLMGVGVVPGVTLSPASLSFPAQVVFTSSKTQTATLTNTGLGILNLTKISVTGPFSQTNTCKTTVVAGGSCTFTMTFKPTTIGTLTGSVSITDNAAGSPQKISLTGVGTYVQLSTPSLNFGNQPVGTKSLPKKITLSNKGSVSVSFTSISVTGTDAKDFAQINTCGKSVAAGASCVITVTFTPLVKGNRLAAISVSDNGGGSPQKVTLAGAGT